MNTEKPLSSWQKSYLSVPAIYLETGFVDKSEFEKIKLTATDNIHEAIDRIKIEVSVEVEILHDEEVDYDVHQEASLDPASLEKAKSIVVEEVATLVSALNDQQQIVLNSFSNEFSNRLQMIEDEKLYHHSEVQDYLYDWYSTAIDFKKTTQMVNQVLSCSISLNETFLASIPTLNENSHLSEEFWGVLKIWKETSLSPVKKLWGQWIIQGEDQDNLHQRYGQMCWVLAKLNDQESWLDLMAELDYKAPEKIQTMELGMLMRMQGKNSSKSHTQVFFEKHLEKMSELFPEWVFAESFSENYVEIGNYGTPKKALVGASSLAEIQEALNEKTWNQAKSMIEQHHLKQEAVVVSNPSRRSPRL